MKYACVWRLSVSRANRSQLLLLSDLTKAAHVRHSGAGGGSNSVGFHEANVDSEALRKKLTRLMQCYYPSAKCPFPGDELWKLTQGSVERLKEAATLADEKDRQQGASDENCRMTALVNHFSFQ